MPETVNLETLALFGLFVLPGLMSMTVYRLLIPARTMEWGQAVIQGLFYSTINYVLCLPLILWISSVGFRSAHPLGFWLLVVLIVVIAPTLWPKLLVVAFRSGWASKLRIPYPSVWDYVFDRRDPVFVLLRLNDGGFAGGYWGPGSYAGSFPNDGDIFISSVYEIDEEGRFGAPVPDSAGLLIRKDRYSLIEFFKVPELESPPMNFGE